MPDPIFAARFEETFGLAFARVVLVEPAVDGLRHYIDHVDVDVYSFDARAEAWLEKNAHKKDVLEALLGI